MFETTKRRVNTAGRKQKRYPCVFEIFGFESFEFVSDFVLRIWDLADTLPFKPPEWVT
jgi:hypothetical protein